MNSEDPEFREYGKIFNVMKVIEELKSNLIHKTEMSTKTRKSIYRNTRGPKPLYDPTVLPERTMQFMREFKDIGDEDKKKTGTMGFNVNEAQYNL
jgi:response regulator RpfG family c-di-GMP phosphodiesterase